MKNLIVIISIVVFSITRLGAQSPTKTKADLAWDNMPVFDLNTHNLLTLEGLKAFDLHKRNYFAAGVKFWQQFPDDKRNGNWFIKATDPSFFKDLDSGLQAQQTGRYTAEVDWEPLKAYTQQRTTIRDAILSNPNLSHELKDQIRKYEIYLVHTRGLNSAYRRDKAVYLAELTKAFEFTIAGIKPKDDINTMKSSLRFIPYVFTNSVAYGYTADDYLTFLNKFKNTNMPQIKEWIGKQLAVFKLKNEPLELKYITVDGEEIDLARLKGKVVLVDFWATTCSTCIRRMPAIKQVYDKYKNRGFTVISAATNPNVDKAKVMAIHKKIDADWPVMLLGGNAKTGYQEPNSIATKLWHTYGFSGVPQLLLLDKNGKLVMHNDLLLHGDFEPIVEKLLADKY